jgi:hypothetical protein
MAVRDFTAHSIHQEVRLVKTPIITVRLLSPGKLRNRRSPAQYLICISKRVGLTQPRSDGN